MKNTLNEVVGILPSEDNLDVYLADIDSARVYNEQDEKSELIDDAQQIKQMYLASAGFDHSRFLGARFTAKQSIDFTSSSNRSVFSSFIIQ